VEILIFSLICKEPDCSTSASIVERVKSQVNGDSEVLVVQTRAKYKCGFVTC
jgi:hypothetical protein